LPRKIKTRRSDKTSDSENKRRYSISTRLFFGITLILSLCVLAIVFVNSSLLKWVYIIRSSRDIRDIANKVDTIYDDISSLSQNLRDIENRFNVSIEIYNPDGLCRYSSNYKADYPMKAGESVPGEYLYKLETVESGDFMGDMRYELREDMFETQYMVCVKQLANGNSIEIFKEHKSFTNSTELTIQYFSYLVITVFSAGLMVFMVFSKRFTKPLKELSVVTRKLSELDFTQKCRVTNTKELANLALNINTLSKSLDTALKDLQQKNKKLEEDIEKEQTIEHLRKNFISNVSHELKTPIAIIQGYAEGIKVFLDGDREKTERYCSVIIEETGRMHIMVMKLLEIIKYDMGDYEPEYEEFSIASLFKLWFKRNEHMLKEKGIKNKIGIDESVTAYADNMLIGSVVNNLLSNAVSHADGEKIINISAEDIHGRYRIFVRNTGDPIAAQDIDKIWQSFYRGDKAMSRAEGRVGLGLAIVAAIQNLHHMEYGVENTDDGVAFWFDIGKK